MELLDQPGPDAAARVVTPSRIPQLGAGPYDRPVHDAPRRSDFKRKTLTAEGFTGWVGFDELRPGGSAVVEHAPGTYVVYRVSGSTPVFLTANPAGRFKGRDPTVPLLCLEANWVDGARVIYIGKADNLAVRVPCMAAYGDGMRVAHEGGRLVWQLADSADLLFAWRPLRDGFATARADEVDMIALFRQVYGKSPFANDPDRIGR